jgi:hypothetical protein
MKHNSLYYRSFFVGPGGLPRLQFQILRTNLAFGIHWADLEHSVGIPNEPYSQIWWRCMDYGMRLHFLFWAFNIFITKFEEMK